MPVSVEMNASPGFCSATVYLTTDQPPAFTPMWLTGLALMLLAFVLFWLIIFKTFVWVHPEEPASWSRPSTSPRSSARGTTLSTA